MFAPDELFTPKAFATYGYPRDIDTTLASVTALASANRPDRYGMPFVEARKLLLQERLATRREWPAMASIDEETLQNGARPISLRWYRPSRPHSGEPIVFMHGGGWCVGSNDTHDTLLRHLAAASQRDVCGVDYALAPEHPFPAALDDVRIVVDTLVRRLERSPSGRPRVILAGDSAGANLALAEAMRRRDEEPRVEPIVAALLLFYGVYAPMENGVGSLAAYGQGGYGLNQAIQQRYLDAYAPGHTQDPRVFPLLGDVSGLPPAWILAAGRDMLLDDSVRLHHAISRSFGRSTLKVADGMTHGFLNLANVLPAARMALEEAGSFVKAVH